MKSGDTSKRKLCMLDYLLDISDAHPAFTEDDIVDEVCTFMLAVSWIYKGRFMILILSCTL
jgi:hypothetical protein